LIPERAVSRTPAGMSNESRDDFQIWHTTGTPKTIHWVFWGRLSYVDNRK
jgi:hypothetical protein